MTIVHSVIIRPKPGRYEDFLALSREAAKLVERHGAQNVRLSGASIAGEAQGTAVFSSECSNAEAHGALQDELSADAEMQSLMARTQSVDAPGVIEQQSVAAELPIRTPKPGRGSVIQVFASRPNPGRLAEAIDLCARACAFAEKQGALNARVFQIGVGGSGTGLYYCSWEHENNRAAGKAGDAWMNDPEGQSIGTASGGSDSPATIVFGATYIDIPL